MSRNDDYFSFLNEKLESDNLDFDPKQLTYQRSHQNKSNILITRTIDSFKPRFPKSIKIIYSELFKASMNF